MMRSAILIVLAAAAVAPAFAQEPTRIRGAGSPAEPSFHRRDQEAEAQRVMNDYARCVLIRRSSLAMRFLQTPPRSREAARAGSRAATNVCLGRGELSFHAPLFRGSLFEALYDREFGRRGAEDLGAVPPIDYAADHPDRESDIARQQTSLRQFADCAVRADPAAAHSLIASEVTSEAESRAFAALGPELNGCLPQGIELRFSRPVLRGLIAETLYRLSAAKAGRPMFADRR